MNLIPMYELSDINWGKIVEYGFLTRPIKIVGKKLMNIKMLVVIRKSKTLFQFGKRRKSNTLFVYFRVDAAIRQLQNIMKNDDCCMLSGEHFIRVSTEKKNQSALLVKKTCGL